MSDFELKIASHKELGERICLALADEIEKLGLDEAIPQPQWQDAEINLKNDPALGDESLEALWLNERGAKLGNVTIHGDGSFFAEYDIVRPHPNKSKWFVEAVSAWGRNDVIKSEARLLPMPE